MEKTHEHHIVRKTVNKASADSSNPELIATQQLSPPSLQLKKEEGDKDAGELDSSLESTQLMAMGEDSTPNETPNSNNDSSPLRRHTPPTFQLKRKELDIETSDIEPQTESIPLKVSTLAESTPVVQQVKAEIPAQSLNPPPLLSTPIAQLQTVSAEPSELEETKTSGPKLSYAAAAPSPPAEPNDTEANSTPIQKQENEASTPNQPFQLQSKENKTGLPDQLKSGIENMSGFSMDDVKVNYNSDKPAQLNAHAYAQGNNIEVAPGQEKHLPHEAWHVVQQKQGRVQPTKQMKGKTPVNDDAGLEKEADVMGAKALQMKVKLNSNIQTKTNKSYNQNNIQLVSDDAEWQSDSEVEGKNRSKKLKKIDTSLAKYNLLKEDPTTTLSQKVSMLNDIDRAISKWKRKKTGIFSGTLKSDRKDAVIALEQQINTELQTLNSVVDTDYTHIHGFGLGYIHKRAEDDYNKKEGMDDVSQANYDRIQIAKTAAGEDTSDHFIRLAMLSEKITTASGLLVNGAGEKELGVFTAPEWFFMQPQNPYNKDQKNAIIEGVKEISLGAPHIVITPGSILWREGDALGTGKYYNTGIVVHRGELIKEVHKNNEGIDVSAYGRDKKADLTKEWLNAGGEISGQNSPANPHKTESNIFDIGNLKFSLEICADGNNKRALQAIERDFANKEENGVHVQILVSAGAAFGASMNAQRAGGIGIHNDGSEGGSRNFHKGGTDKSNKIGEGLNKDTLAQIDMGRAALPAQGKFKNDNSLSSRNAPNSALIQLYNDGTTSRLNTYNSTNDTTLQKKQIYINDNEGLEKEADEMGAKALQLKQSFGERNNQNKAFSETVQRVPNNVAQLDVGDEGDTSEAVTLLGVAKQLVADLEGHKRGWLIDLKPKKIYGELKKVEKKITELTDEQGRLVRLIESGKTLAAYNRALSTMQTFKLYYYGKSTDQYKSAKAKKKEIEKSLGVKGFKNKTKEKNVRSALSEASNETRDLELQLEETKATIQKLHQLSIEIRDRTVARGVQLEELAKSKGEAARFPFDANLEGQLDWLETWMNAYPEVAEKAKADMAANEEILQNARSVESMENTYAFEAGVYQKLITDYAELTKPGTSMSQSLKFTFTAGEGLEAGFFIKVAGEIATGDDRKIRPKLAFTVGGTIKVDLGIWDASASLSVTFAMVQGFDGLHHFAANYMRILSLYDLSFKNYIELSAKVGSLRKDDPEYNTKRTEMIKEAAKRGFIAQGQTIEMGTTDEAELSEMQAKPPVNIKAVKGAVDAGIAPNDNASGPLAHFGGITFSASYTRKWFTRLVDYSKFVEANGEVDEELERLKSIRADYLKLLTELDDTRRYIKMATLGAVPPMLTDKEKELEKLKNLYEEGNLTFFRKGRKKFKKELAEKIEELEGHGETTNTEDIEGISLEDIRSAESNKKKKLTKIGSVWEVEIGGSVSLGGLAVNLGGKFSVINNDANPDNDGKYLNLSLKAGTDITAEALDPDSDAGQKALDSIAESGNFQDASLSPTSSAVTGQLITNLAGNVQTVSGVLAGGVKLELNTVWSNGWWRTQYVRVTRSKDITMGLTAKTGMGANVGFQYSGGSTNFIAERIGNNTLTYVLTVYQGMRKHKDWETEWNAWKGNHKKQIWEILQQIGLAMTTSRTEMLDLPNGEAQANRIHRIVRPMFAQQKMEEDYSGGPLDFNQEKFDQTCSILETAMEAEFTHRGSLEVADLSEANWHSAEGAVNSQIHLDVGLFPNAASLSNIQVASKSTLTNRAKGARESVEDFTRFGTLQGLSDAGASLKLRIKTGGGNPEYILVSIPSGGDTEKNLKSGAKDFVKAIKSKKTAVLNTYTLLEHSFLISSLKRGTTEEKSLVESAIHDLRRAMDISVPAR